MKKFAKIYETIEEKCSVPMIRYSIIAFLAVCTYGYVIANPVIGVDDESFAYHFDNFGVIPVGRYGYIILKAVLNSYAYLPFWRDSIAVLLLLFGAFIYIKGFLLVFGKELSNIGKLFFTTLLITAPVIAKLFVYIASNVEVSLMLVFSGGAMYYTTKWIVGCHKRHLAIVVFFLVAGLSMIENSINYYVTAMCFQLSFMLLQIYNKPIEIRKGERQRIIKGLLMFVFLSVCSIILNEIIKRIMIYAFKVNNTNYGSKFIIWNISNINNQFIALINGLKDNFSLLITQTFYFKVFISACIIVMGISVYQSFRNKDLMFLIFGIICCASTLAFYIITGNPKLPNRVFVVFGLFVAISMLYLNETLQKESVKVILFALIMLVVFYQSKETQCFYQNDHLRFEKDKRIASVIYTDIEKVCGGVPSVPVVFIGDILPYVEYPNTDDEVSMRSFFTGNSDGVSTHIHSFFNALGYRMQSPLLEELTPENINHIGENNYTNEAIELAKHMPYWPETGYVASSQDVIVVKLGPLSIQEYDWEKENFLVEGKKESPIKGDIFVSKKDSNNVYIRGAACLLDRSSAGTRILINIYNDYNSYLLKTVQSTYPLDVYLAKYDDVYNNTNAFYTYINASNVEPGTYSIRIIAINGNYYGIKEATNLVFTKESEAE